MNTEREFCDTTNEFFHLLKDWPQTAREHLACNLPSGIVVLVNITQITAQPVLLMPGDVATPCPLLLQRRRAIYL